MAQKLKGVGGVLGGLISPEPESPAQPEPFHSPIADAPPAEAAKSEATERPVAAGKPRPKQEGRIAARRGRPPGQKSGEAAEKEKEKVTLRLSKELIDDYRDWSWEERCQIGELVERALLHYRKQQARTKSQ